MTFSLIIHQPLGNPSLSLSTNAQETVEVRISLKILHTADRITHNITFHLSAPFLLYLSLSFCPRVHSGKESKTERNKRARETERELEREREREKGEEAGGK